MTKTLKNKNLLAHAGSRALLAMSLSVSMVAFGCTTDRTLGNGDPVGTPGVRTSPSGATTGSESEPLPPPMMASSSFTPRALLVTPAQAAALMAQQQPPRMRVLGPASPDSGGRAYSSDAASSAQPAFGQQATVNSSINGQQAAAGVLSGAGEAVGGDPEVIDGFLDTIGATDPNTPTVVPPSTGGTGTNNTVTPTGSATGVPLGGTFPSIGTLSPTAATVINPPASVSGSPTLASQSSARTGAATPTPATPAATATVAPRNVIGSESATPAATAGAVNVTPTTVPVNSVRVVNTNGRVVITNDSTNRNQ